MAGGEVRAFYEALGIVLPGWAHTEAPVSCFADPGAHKREDRDASCSVNLNSGAFNCHGCGARGGAYDAALARGLSPREAIDLMVSYGLTDRRPRDTAPARSTVSTRDTSRVRAGKQSRETATQASFALTDEQVREWTEELQRSVALIARLERERGWSRRALLDLKIGFDGERITVPIWRLATPAERVSGRGGLLQGVLRLRVGSTQRPKVTAVRGTRLGLLPPPAWIPERRVLLVEGASDMLAARSAGLPAIAVPGANAWRPEWASALDGRTAVVMMDCDQPGRRAAARIAGDLARRGIAAGIGDLAPGRQDGYDVSDWLRDGNAAGQLLYPQEMHSASAYTRVSGLPAPPAAAAAPRTAAQPRRMTGAGARSTGATQRGGGCRTS